MLLKDYDPFGLVLLYRPFIFVIFDGRNKTCKYFGIEGLTDHTLLNNLLTGYIIFDKHDTMHSVIC
jgi:hypothetical protein